MSKYFNRTQRAEEWSAGEGTAKSLSSLEKMVDAVNEVTAGSSEMAEQRLGRCRKMKLPQVSTAPVLFSQNYPTFVGIQSYRTLRTRLMRLQSTTGLRSVVLTSSVSGEGKTLTGLNLALCCAQLHDLRVLLIDGDLCTRGLTGLLGNPPAPGLSEVLARSAQPEQAVIATDLPNLHILGAGAPTVPSLELYASNRWKELIGWCGENFKLVLVDSPPILPLADFELMSAACDGVLLIVRALQTSRELLRKAASAVDKKKFLGVVFNGADFNGQGSYSDRSGYSNSDVPK